MVVFDATILLPILWPDVPAPVDAATNKPVERFRERIDYLVQRLEKDRSKMAPRRSEWNRRSFLAA